MCVVLTDVMVWVIVVYSVGSGALCFDLEAF